MSGALAAMLLSRTPPAAGTGNTRTQVFATLFPDSPLNATPVGYNDQCNGNGLFTVITGQVLHVNYNGQETFAVQTGTYANDDQYAAMDVSGWHAVSEGSKLGLTINDGTGVKGSPGVTAYAIYFQNDAVGLIKVDKVVLDVPTNLYTSSSLTLSGTENISVERKGTSLWVLRGGVVMPSMPITLASALTGGKPGLYGFAGSEDILRGDAYSSGNIT